MALAFLRVCWVGVCGGDGGIGLRWWWWVVGGGGITAGGSVGLWVGGSGRERTPAS